jgi:hypothetical protein
MREKEFCVRCGKKEFEYSFCEEKLKCNACGYFLCAWEFEELKEKAKKND